MSNNEQLFKTIVVEFSGGSNTGKTTMANAVTAELGFRGMSAAYLAEYVKGPVLEGRTSVLEDQRYLYTKHRRQLLTRLGKYQVIICDGGMAHSLHYAVSEDPEELADFRRDVIKKIRKLKIVHYYFERRYDIPFETVGRYQSSHEEASKDDGGILAVLRDILAVPFKITKSDRKLVNLIADEIQMEIKKSEM